ncbi:MAG: nuclear transport factor 2 family protein [Deinococcota bacterium]
MTKCIGLTFVFFALNLALAQQVMTPKDIVIGYMETVVNNQQIDDIDTFISPNLIQHNPNLPNGLEPLRNFWMGFFVDVPEANFRIVRVIAENSLVAVHSHFTPVPDALGLAVVDIFRVEDGLIVEHWDVSMEIPAETASGNSVTD